MKSEVISIRVDPETKRQLTQICKKENRSISNLLGIIVGKYLNCYKK